MTDSRASTERQKQQQDAPAHSLIRKLTTEKATKAHRQQMKEKAAPEDDITHIKLSSRGIKTIESLDLPSLRRLDLSKNSLNRLKGLQGCPQVTYLTAAGNELTGDGLDGVRPLKDLKVLNASSNRVRRIPPAVFAQFLQLQALVLNNNEIAEVPPTWLKKGLLSLNTLILSHNKVQSLSDSGLGRLTALTKLSVSHNALVELPDLSGCSGLEELRAAHNLISQVPSSLTSNTSLRTLDLGHNRIEKWLGLERLGKSLKSLMQLSLAGNPLCGTTAGPAAAATTGDKDRKKRAATDGDGEVEAAEDEEYLAKVRSLFPLLKVRDGKRILMKKSHTYYEQRASNEGGDDTSGSIDRRKDGIASARQGGRHDAGDGLELGSSDVGRRVVGEGDRRKKKRDKTTSKSKSVRIGRESEVPGPGGIPADIIDPQESDRREDDKTERKRKRNGDRVRAIDGSAKPERATAAAKADGSNDGLDKSSKKRRRRRLQEEQLQEQEETRTSGSTFETATTAGGVSSKGAGDTSSSKKSRRRSEKAAARAAAAAETAVAADDDGNVGVEGSAEGAAKGTKTKARKGKTKHEGKAKVEGDGAGGSRSGQNQEDPYSSSEELPIPGRVGPGGGGGSTGKAAGGAPSSSTASGAGGGDRESGVVSVVVNKKRSKSGKGANVKPWRGGAAAAVGGAKDVGGFSVDAMLEARSEKETIGLGLGVSAWD